MSAKTEIKPAEKKKALEGALAQIEKTFGKGSIMKLGSQERPELEV
ncbi:MAG: DNA recombination/repair protein RecA, partial [Alphaproteobacteria bacterium]